MKIELNAEIAQILLKTLFQLFVSLDQAFDGYNQILISILELLRQLKNLPHNEGWHILQYFIWDKNNFELVEGLSVVLLDTLIFVST